MRIDNKLFILSNDRVAAIDKKTGDIVWEIRLKAYVKTSMSYASIGQIMLEGSMLYVSIPGIVICLSAKDGSLVWKNELKGWGYSFVSMTGAQVPESGAEAASIQAVNAAVIASTVATAT